MNDIAVRPIESQSVHLAAIRRLWRANSATLGFFPEGAFEDHARRGQVLVASSSGDDLVGYLLYRVTARRVVIVHLCVERLNRRRDVAKLLLDALRERTSQCLGVRVRCREDFEASRVWPRLGFHPVADSPGRRQEGSTLTTWWLDYGHPDLFSQMPESRNITVLDANVLFDMQDPRSPSHEESKALLADWLQEWVVLCVTDEIYHEIQRRGSARERNRQWTYVSYFNKMPYDPVTCSEVLSELRPIYRAHPNQSQVSDLNQLSKAIACGAHFFVTRDDRILALVDDIANRWSMMVVRPCELVVLTDEAMHEARYRPARLAGALIHTRRVQASEIDGLAASFQNFSRREPKSGFVKVIRNALSSPRDCECTIVLGDSNSALGLLVADRSRDGILKIPLLRVRKGPFSATLARHLVWHSVTKSTDEDRAITAITDVHMPETVATWLPDACFAEGASGWVKVNLRGIQDRDATLEQLKDLAEEHSDWQEQIRRLLEPVALQSRADDPVSGAGIERLLWPAKIGDRSIPSFIVPIKPQWAMHLFEQTIASQTLLGSDPRLALSTENVYYRACRPRVLSAPSRVLWYVSQNARYAGSKHVRACSQVKEVVVGPAKEVFRRFQRLGVYRWEDIGGIARGGPNHSVMAFSFTHTEVFPKPIPWVTLQEVLEREDGSRSQLQSPIAISEGCFRELYLAGTSG